MWSISYVFPPQPWFLCFFSAIGKDIVNLYLDPDPHSVCGGPRWHHVLVFAYFLFTHIEMAKFPFPCKRIGIPISSAELTPSLCPGSTVLLPSSSGCLFARLFFAGKTWYVAIKSHSRGRADDSPDDGLFDMRQRPAPDPESECDSDWITDLICVSHS